MMDRDQDEPDRKSAGLLKALQQVRAEGGHVLGVVVCPRLAGHAAVFCAFYGLELIVDAHRSLDAGAGIRYELEEEDDEPETYEEAPWHP